MLLTYSDFRQKKNTPLQKHNPIYLPAQKVVATDVKILLLYVHVSAY